MARAAASILCQLLEGQAIERARIVDMKQLMNGFWIRADALPPDVRFHGIAGHARGASCARLVERDSLGG